MNLSNEINLKLADYFNEHTHACKVYALHMQESSIGIIGRIIHH